MRITGIKATNISLTDAIRSRVETKAIQLSKLTKEFDPASELKVEVGKSSRHHAKGPYYRAEFQMSVPGTDLRAVAEEEDLYHAIGQARDQIRRQLKDYKNKLHDKSKRAERPNKK